MDAPPVVLTCPDDLTVDPCLTPGQINGLFSGWLAEVQWGGGCNASISDDNTGAPPKCGGSTTVTWTVTSDCEDDVTCSATFTVTDAPPVTLTCPDDETVASCLSQGQVNSLFSDWMDEVVWGGGCKAVLKNNNIGAPPKCGGSTTVTWRVESSCEDDVTCSATFTVTEPDPVIVTYPDNVHYLECTFVTQEQVNLAFDNWLALFTYTGGCDLQGYYGNPEPPVLCDGGTISVDFTVWDSKCYETTTETRTFILDPDTPPTISGVPDDQIVECEGQYTFVMPEVVDACDPNAVLDGYNRDDGRPFNDPYFEPGTVTTFCFWYTDACDQYVEECFTVTAELCPYWCTYTQGFYGNAGGTTCWGQSTPGLLTQLLATPLVIGCDNGGRDFTIGAGDYQCVLDLLPGGGGSVRLKPGHGTCGDPNFKVHKSGRAKNALVAQTITLSLNLREGGSGWGMGNLPMYNGHFRTTDMINCDPTIIPDDYSINPDIWTDYYIDQGIICYLYDYGYDHDGDGISDIYDLFDLANNALCNSMSGFTLRGELTDALSTINEGFDECRWGEFVDEPYDCGDNAIGGGSSNSFIARSMLKASPNPFSELANIEFTIPMTVRVSLEVYTLQGQHVETLYTGMAEEDVIHTYQFHAKGIHNQSVYVYVLKTIYGTKVGKMIMIK